MSQATLQPGLNAEPATPDASLSASDLAELMASFNEVTSRLEQTHGQLRGEVRRLSEELREANEALQRSRRLAALGEMAAGIAHEVRNPLGSIGLYASMLEEDLHDRPECRGVAVKIGSAVRGLDAVVGDVLSFAREIRVRSCPGHPRELLERAVEVCRAEAGPIAIRIMAEEAPEFEHDPALMHQAMVNLIRNACDATRASGGDTILLSAGSGLVDPDGPDPSPGVVLRIRDEGDGFEPEAIERVFNPFFTTRAAGTGLGLPIVHRIVDAHGGAISISNNPPSGPSQIAGATVELRFPLRAARSIPDVVVAAGSRPAHALSVQELSVNEESL